MNAHDIVQTGILSPALVGEHSKDALQYKDFTIRLAKYESRVCGEGPIPCQLVDIHTNEESGHGAKLPDLFDIRKLNDEMRRHDLLCKHVNFYQDYGTIEYAGIVNPNKAALYAAVWISVLAHWRWYNTSMSVHPHRNSVGFLMYAGRVISISGYSLFGSRYGG